MDNLKYITFSKIHNYNTNDGKFCYINCLNDNLIIDTYGKVTFDVDFS